MEGIFELVPYKVKSLVLSSMIDFHWSTEPKWVGGGGRPELPASASSCFFFANHYAMLQNILLFLPVAATLGIPFPALSSPALSSPASRRLPAWVPTPLYSELSLIYRTGGHPWDQL